jgi:hypothetical protein
VLAVRAWTSIAVFADYPTDSAGQRMAQARKSVNARRSAGSSLYRLAVAMSPSKSENVSGNATSLGRHRHGGRERPERRVAGVEHALEEKP